MQKNAFYNIFFDSLKMIFEKELVCVINVTRCWNNM